VVGSIVCQDILFDDAVITGANEFGIGSEFSSWTQQFNSHINGIVYTMEVVGTVEITFTSG
jgi:hypothetical protein